MLWKRKLRTSKNREYNIVRSNICAQLHKLLFLMQYAVSRACDCILIIVNLNFNDHA